MDNEQLVSVGLSPLRLRSGGGILETPQALNGEALNEVKPRNGVSHRNGEAIETGEALKIHLRSLIYSVLVAKSCVDFDYIHCRGFGG